MGGKRVPQGVTRDPLVETGFDDGLAYGALHDGLVKVMTIFDSRVRVGPARARGEDPLPRPFLRSRWELSRQGMREDYEAATGDEVALVETAGLGEMIAQVLLYAAR